MPTTSHDPRYYVTVKDPRRGTSRTITIHGSGLSAQRIIRLVQTAVAEMERKAG